MIVVDSSALIAILRSEPQRDACLDALDRCARRFMSAGTLAECFVVAEGKNIGGRMLGLIQMLEPTILPVTEDTARQVHAAIRQWGKGRHPAGLNFGDCFSYVAARQARMPLLYTGNDFSQTDIASVL